MANIKSAKKRIITSAKRTAANKAVKSSVKTAIKKVHKAVEAGDKEAAPAFRDPSESRFFYVWITGNTQHLLPVSPKNKSSKKEPLPFTHSA